MNYIDVRRISDEYLRNEPCDVCGRPKAVTKRCLVQFTDCGYGGELNICTWDLRSVEHKDKRIEAPRRDHFHVESEKQRTWFTLEDLFAWIRMTMAYPNFQDNGSGKAWKFNVEPKEGKIIRCNNAEGAERGCAPLISTATA